MATPQKLRWAKLRVGLLSIAALIIAAVLIFLLTGNTSFFEGYYHVRTYMEDSAGMTESAPVRLNGILVGTVKHVRLSGEKNRLRIVEIQMSIKQKFHSQMPEDSIAAISASNLLGDKYINISKGQSQRPVADNGELKSLQAQDIPQLMAQSATILTQFQNILGRADNILAEVESGKGNIGKLIKDDELYTRVNATAAQVQSLIGDVKNSKGTISKLIYDDTLYKEVRRPIQRLDDMLAQLQQGKGTAGKLLNDNAVYEEARQSVAEARKLLDGLNAGKGTAGKLLKDEELYRQVNQVMAKLNTTVDKLNAGQGTLGQLLVNQQLYNSLNGVSREMNLLVQDMHKNPKKFLRIKLALF
jgi:phospholipid/cholesterol/gamma-HCH transport system substrate-binding protein